MSPLSGGASNLFDGESGLSFPHHPSMSLSSAARIPPAHLSQNTKSNLQFKSNYNTPTGAVLVAVAAGWVLRKAVVG
jgi:hypothetical protein